MSKTIAAMLAVYGFVRQFAVALSDRAYRVPAYVIGGIAAFWLIERTVGFWTS